MYQPYVLLKTYEALHGFNSISLADKNGNSDIRELLRLTYLSNQDDPESWNILAFGMKGTECAERQLAISNTRLFAMAALNDEEGKQTRLNEIETIQLVIATHVGTETITLLNGDKITLEQEKFNIHHARSIHQNIIRVHAWPFEQTDLHKAVPFYLKGKHCLAVLSQNSELEIEGLKDGVTIKWSELLGIVQTYVKGGADESCD